MAGLTELSAAFFAAGHDGGVEAVAHGGRQLVELVGAVDFDGFAGSVEGDLAVVAAAEVFFHVGADLGGETAVNQFVELSNEFRAGHRSPAFLLRK